MNIAPRLEPDTGALDDAAFMAAALALGRRNLGRVAPNPAVGALVVRDGAVVARGWTAVSGRPHAERIALEAAGEAAREATLYVTLEPCCHHGATPPCADLIVASGVSRVVSALEDPDPRVAGRGHAQLREAGIVVVTGIGADVARRDHLGHILRVTEGRPMVTLKLARTADGYVAGTEHDPRLFITGAVADAYTHVQRALHDAIMIGAGTARVDDPLMTVRLPGMEGLEPLRVVLDTHLSLSPHSRLAATAHETPTLVVVGEGVSDEAASAFTAATGIEVARVGCDESGRVDLLAALRLLGARGVTRVLCEGGPSVAEGLLLRGFADAVILHTGLRPLGRLGRPALSPAAQARLGDPAFYRISDEAMLGRDRMTRHERLG